MLRSSAPGRCLPPPPPRPPPRQTRLRRLRPAPPLRAGALQRCRGTSPTDTRCSPPKPREPSPQPGAPTPAFENVWRAPRQRPEAARNGWMRSPNAPVPLPKTLAPPARRQRSAPSSAPFRRVGPGTIGGGLHAAAGHRRGRRNPRARLRTCAASAWWAAAGAAGTDSPAATSQPPGRWSEPSARYGWPGAANRPVSGAAGGVCRRR
jgi:hypothetical protein